MDSERRETLIDTMTSAKSEEEITKAQRDADLWLRENPTDTAVMAAKQTLDQRSEKLDDPERKANKVTWVSLAVTVPLAIAVALTFSINWGVAVVVGVLVGSEIAFWVWEYVGEWAESRSKRGSSDSNP